MEKLYRDQYALFIDTTPGEETSNYVLEATGVESLALSFNPQVEQFKQINQRNSNAEFQNYQIQSSVSEKRCYKGDEMFEFLDKARRYAKSITTTAIEVDSAYENEDKSYQSVKYDILIVINEFLGESVTISYDLYVKGDPVNGSSVMTSGKPVFTAEA